MKFKHKETGHIAVKSGENYFIDTVNYITNVPSELIEHSGDWELVKEKKYLFTTYDGVKIYKGMKSTTVCKVRLIIIGVDTYLGNSSNAYIYFSTPEAAQKYIDENTKKPILTTEDGKELFEGDSVFGVNLVYGGISINPWSITKEKVDSVNIYEDKRWKNFSTEQSAKDYINLHKPKFSKKEIQDIFDKIGKQTGIGINSDLFLNHKDE